MILICIDKRRSARENAVLSLKNTGATVSITLAAFKSGDTGRVVNLSHSNSLYRQKLLSMGLTPGTCFLVKRIAPLGDPIEIAVRGYSLSLRKHEADVLEVERVTQ